MASNALILAEVCYGMFTARANALPHDRRMPPWAEAAADERLLWLSMAMALLAATGPGIEDDGRRCMDCGGEGGGGTMDPDVWIECDTCKGAGVK